MLRSLFCIPWRSFQSYAVSSRVDWLTSWHKNHQWMPCLSQNTVDRIFQSWWRFRVSPCHWLRFCFGDYVRHTVSYTVTICLKSNHLAVAPCQKLKYATLLFFSLPVCEIFWYTLTTQISKTQFSEHNFMKKWTRNFRKMHWQCHIGDSVLVIFNFCKQLIINQRPPITSFFIVNLFTPFIKTSHPFPYHRFTRCVCKGLTKVLTEFVGQLDPPSCLKMTATSMAPQDFNLKKILEKSRNPNLFFA